MKKSIVLLCSVILMLSCIVSANAGVLFQDNFETSWTGDYAPGWVNADYRHGTAPVGKMMQQTTTSHTGTYGLKLIADSTPESWMWWAAVEVDNLSPAAMSKQYDPYISAWYYEEGETGRAGQIYSVPDWVNPYLSGGEDWTDIQHGDRFNKTDNYYYVAAGENSPGWQNTGVAQSIGWHQLKFQLSSADGHVHFYVDGTEVGQSYRDDYTDLGTSVGLYTMFQNPLSGWGENKPSTIWDDFQVGSSYSVPDTSSSILLFGICLSGLFGIRKKFWAN